LAIGGMLALALVIAVAVMIAGIHYLHVRTFKAEPQLTADTLYNLLKVAFAVAAGIGGVVALVTAYRRQRISEFAEQREGDRLFNERFATTAGQLGHDSPAVRLAGVYAMAGLADDWPAQRQTCIDVLCAYLRMPYPLKPPRDKTKRQAYMAGLEVRATVISVIAAHLQGDDRRSATSQDWRGHDFDFTGAAFNGGSFAYAQFTGGDINFASAQFTMGAISFWETRFLGGTVSFLSAEFGGGTAIFDRALFSGSDIDFRAARLNGGTLTFNEAHCSGGSVDFSEAEFTGSNIDFTGAHFTGGTVIFGQLSDSARPTD
jgi:hypothetical protein